MATLGPGLPDHLRQFLKTPLGNAYLHELSRLAVNVLESLDTLFTEEGKPAVLGGQYRIGDGFIRTDGRLHRHIEAALIDAANIDKFMRPPTGNKRNADDVVKMRELRTELLATIVHGLDLSAIKQVDLRNSLEHFYGDLDRLNVKMSKGEVKWPLIAYNLAVSDLNVFNQVWPASSPPLTEIGKLRLYVVKERAFYNFGHAMDLTQLRTQVRTVLDRVAFALNGDVAGGAFFISPQEP